MVNDPTKYLLNAYESLKLAARLPQRPMCGNRLFVSVQNQVKVQRSGPTDLETISAAVSAGDSIRVAYGYHGGRRVGIFTDLASNQFLNLSGTAWTLAPWVLHPPTELAGTWHSTRGTTHDGDSLFTAIDVPTGGGTRVDVHKGTTSSTGPVIGTVTVAHLRQRGNTVPTFRAAGSTRLATLQAGATRTLWTPAATKPRSRGEAGEESGPSHLRWATACWCS